MGEFNKGRERSAAIILAGMISKDTGVFPNYKTMAKNAVTAADALVVALSEPQHAEQASNGATGMPIGHLNLSTRAANCLVREDIHTVEDLLMHTHHDLGLLRNMGELTLNQIEDALVTIGQPRLRGPRSSF